MNEKIILKKHKRNFTLLLAAGIVLLCLSFVDTPYSATFSGFGIGCTSAALPILVIFKYISKNDRKIKEVVANEQDERLINIRNKAGCKAYWIIYFILIGASVVSNYIEIEFKSFMTILIVFSAILYFVLLGIYNKDSVE